jgi:hypothetical protein
MGVIRIIATTWGVFSVAALIGLYWPKAFGSMGGAAFFEEPPKWLKSAALAGIVVAIVIDVSPIIALGVLVLWGRRFPQHFNWLAESNFFESAPGWWNATSEWVTPRVTLPVKDISWPMVIDVIGCSLVLIGLAFKMHALGVVAIVLLATVVIIFLLRFSGAAAKVAQFIESV